MDFKNLLIFNPGGSICIILIKYFYSGKFRTMPGIENNRSLLTELVSDWYKHVVNDGAGLI